MQTCKVIDLGTIAYADAFALQQQLVAARKAGACGDVLLLCEHPHVITLGRNGKLEHLRVSAEFLSQRGVEFHHTDRGGDITYHGPGQIVGYPILHLGEIRRDVGWYVRQLEQTIIEASKEFGVAAFRVPGCTGVWVRGEQEESGSDERGVREAGATEARKIVKEKLGAIGVHLSRWVTSHGFAYNVSPDLRYFDLIVPCGIPDCRTMSLEKILGRKIDLRVAQQHIVEAFGEALGFEMISASREEIDEWMETAALAAEKK